VICELASVSDFYTVLPKLLQSNDQADEFEGVC
jgi:hypothetical protein